MCVWAPPFVVDQPVTVYPERVNQLLAVDESGRVRFTVRILSRVRFEPVPFVPAANVTV